MTRFTYARGNWEDGNSLPEWTDNEEFETYLQRIGYSSSKFTVGSEHGSSIEIFGSPDTQSFYSTITPFGGNCYEVFLPDFPSLMMFLKDFGPVFAAIAIGGDQQEILSLLEKLFHVYHGHSAHSICNKCDPAQWEASVKRREARSKSGDVA